MKRLALLALAACTSAACSITVPNGTGPSIRTVTVTPPATSPTRTYAQPSTPSVTGPKTEIDSDGTYVVGVDILRTYRTLAALAAIGRGYVALIPATSLTTTPARKPLTFSLQIGRSSPSIRPRASLARTASNCRVSHPERAQSDPPNPVRAGSFHCHLDTGGLTHV